MIKNSFFTTLKSFTIVAVVSFIGSYAAYISDVNYIATFIFLFIIQFIILSFLKDVIVNYFKEKTKQKQLDYLEPLSSILECAYCNESNLVTFFPNQNERIEFECTKCKNKNLVNLVFSVARVTEPINIPKLTGIPLVDEKK